MLVDRILDILTNLAVSFLNKFPTWALPTWYETAIEGWGGIVSGTADLAHWVPLDAVAQVAIAVGLVSTFAITVRVLRIIFSFVSGGGGGAA